MKTLVNPTHAPKNIHEIDPEVKKNRLTFMAEYTKECLAIADTLPLKISKGNRKTDSKVPSISLRPILDCSNCKSCSGLCYDIRNDCMYKGTMKTRCENFAIWKTNPKRYFDGISSFCGTQVAFRWHVGGDIVNMDYLKGMVRVAEQNPHCKFLAFTKRFELVNKYLDENKLPKNLQIVFSGWVGLEMDNRHNLPSSHPLFADGRSSKHEWAKECKGNCSNCLMANEGCWTLKNGEEVYFAAH